MTQAAPVAAHTAFTAAGYSGPLSLLLDLIEQRKVDICEVSLAQITDDYLRKISQVEWPDLEESSRFLIVAATLLFIKARVLMPKRRDLEAEPEEEGLDPAELLVDRLKTYKVFRDVARRLRAFEEAASHMLRRGRYEQLEARWKGNPLEGQLPSDLYDILERVLDKGKDERIEAPGEEIPLADFMNSLIGALKRRRAADFKAAIGAVRDRAYLIGCFLALLELARLGIVTLSQACPSEPIWMSLKEEVAENGPS